MNIEIDTKMLRKYLPEKRIDSITEALIAYELENRKDIVDQALESISRIGKYSKWHRLAVLLTFFTGLRSTEISYLFSNWDKLREYELTEWTLLKEVNYDRKKKKAYITIIPKPLFSYLDKVLPYNLSRYWHDDVYYRYGVKVSLFRKSWTAIASDALDEAERNLLLGRLRTIEVRHYIKHIKKIAEKYERAFKRFEDLIRSQLSLLSTES